MERVRLNRSEQHENDGRGSEGPRGNSDEPLDREKLIRRIQKLLALALDVRGNNDEAKSAFERARHLMAKYGISIEEVNAFPKPTEDDEDDPAANDTTWRDAPEDDPNLWHAAVDGYQLVKDLRHLVFRHYLVMSERQTMACALWVLHTHSHDVAHHSPILIITAPTQECGKSQLLECLEYLVPRPFATADITPAAVFNEIEAYYSTILIDEAETFMAYHNQMRGILNSGHKRGGFVSRKGCRYSTWAPKAIALNGHLHPTLESRSIIIRMERKLKGETVARLTKPKPEDAENHLNILRRMCARWAHDNIEALRSAQSDLPQELDDRAKDNWMPLLAIADACGWPKKARRAALQIAAEKNKETPPAIQLFRDLKRLFKEGSPLSSREIVASLVRMEARPWAELARGRALTTTALAHLLKPFKILPSEVKTHAGRRANGYRREQFDDVFKRYLAK